MAVSRTPRQRRGSRQGANNNASFPLPVDVMLGIFCQLSIRDILNIRKTCRIFFEISQLRSLWYLLLRNHVLRENIPIPGLGTRPIDTLSAVEIERCTRRALRLRRIWTSPSPVAARRVGISPTSERQARNIAVQFLPGRGHRWLFSITAVPGDQPRWYLVQCWDVTVSPPACIAMRRISELVSFAINTDPNDKAILALLHPQSVASTNPTGDFKLMRFCSVEIFTINFSARDPESAFVSMAILRRRKLKELSAFTGTSILAQGFDGRLIFLNVNNHDVETELRDTNTQPERCQAAIIRNEFVMIIRPSSFQIYPLMPYRATLAAKSHSCVIQPVAQHKWPWRVDSVCVAQSIVWSPAPSATAYPTIKVLIRFGTPYWWPSNVLHHYILQPNTSYSRRASISTRNLPYLSPRFLQSVASPVRLFSSSHAAIGPYGTAVWIDNHTEDYFMQNGQRLAGRLFRQADAAGSVQTVAPSEIPSDTMASTVYVVKEHDDWIRVALDEQEGRIAIGDMKGKISLFEYS